MQFDYKTAAERLWDILDDIDTLSDSMKPEQTAFYQAVMEWVAKRHSILKSDGYELTPVED